MEEGVSPHTPKGKAAKAGAVDAQAEPPVSPSSSARAIGCDALASPLRPNDRPTLLFNSRAAGGRSGILW